MTFTQTARRDRGATGLHEMGHVKGADDTTRMHIEHIGRVFSIFKYRCGCLRPYCRVLCVMCLVAEILHCDISEYITSDVLAMNVKVYTSQVICNVELPGTNYFDLWLEGRFGNMTFTKTTYYERIIKNDSALM